MRHLSDSDGLGYLSQALFFCSRLPIPMMPLCFLPEGHFMGLSMASVPIFPIFQYAFHYLMLDALGTGHGFRESGLT